jgi:hypothetical protein
VLSFLESRAQQQIELITQRDGHHHSDHKAGDAQQHGHYPRPPLAARCRSVRAFAEAVEIAREKAAAAKTAHGER